MPQMLCILPDITRSPLLTPSLYPRLLDSLKFIDGFNDQNLNRVILPESRFIILLVYL